ncbi:MAG: beta-glucosidase [Thermoleophilia bacterium]|nr:beta-glucosidase [Thermoleophilia bacterium]
MQRARHRFPSGFVFGAATSAYQVEGAVTADGRGESIWDRFCAQPGAVRAGDSGEEACDFYHRFPQDVELMRELGIDAFRFSIAWPRVLPEGRGRVEQRGLDFYDRLVDALLEAGIRPFATLYHWDLPQRLEDEGGWPERATAEAFVEYVETVAERLGDRVADWTTHNEPFCSAWLGYASGAHAPGRSSVADGIAAAHHILLSHGWAVEALRRTCPGSSVGIVLDCWPVHPASDDPADVEACRRVDALRNRLYFDAVFRGAYPEEALEQVAPAAPPIRDGDLAAISRPLDFVGVNNYSRMLVRAGADGVPVEVRAPQGRLTEMGWEVVPDALHEVLTRIHREYRAQRIYVTENGAAFYDVRLHDGRVHDPERIDYLDRHLAAVARAIEAGVPVAGYFVWSLLDNFEWAHGYAKRFGLVYVDYPTQQRVPKDSFYWYRDLLTGRRAAATPV